RGAGLVGNVGGPVDRVAQQRGPEEARPAELRGVDGDVDVAVAIERAARGDDLGERVVGVAPVRVHAEGVEHAGAAAAGRVHLVEEGRGRDRETADDRLDARVLRVDGVARGLVEPQVGAGV